MEYKIVKGTIVYMFEIGVSQIIEEGWKPIGGISTCYNHICESIQYAQAMIKDDNTSK